MAETVNLLDPELISLMGEGLDMLDLDPAAFDDGLSAHLEQVPRTSVRIDRPPFASVCTPAAPPRRRSASCSRSDPAHTAPDAGTSFACARIFFVS